MRVGIDALNAMALVAALGLAGYGGGLSTGRGIPEARRGPELTSRLSPETLADGTRVLRDASGTKVPLVPYRHIASGTMIADRVLADLCEPERIVAFTDYSAQSSLVRYRYAGKPTLSSRAPLEQVLALKPDLFIVNNLVDPGYVARLREHGVRVFDLGHMRGLDTLLPNIRAIGHLIGAPDRGEAYAQALARRMAAVAARKPSGEPPRALYVSIIADRLFGGGARTSYHDVIESAGLRDAGALAGLDGWPELTAERVLAIDPDVLLTKTGMGRTLCAHAGFERLRPCRGDGRLIELNGVMLDDPGPVMLDAAEALYDAYWQKPAKP